MRYFAFLLVGSFVAASVSATEVQVFPPTYAARKKPESIARQTPSATIEVPARALPVTPSVAVATPVAAPVAAAVPARASAVAVSAPLRASVTPRASTAKEFTFQDRSGKVSAAPIVEHYQKSRIVYPLAKIDTRLNPKLIRAATIAQERSRAHSKSSCWRYVKNALLASGIISSYPKTAYAKQAGEELVRDYGFKKLPIRDPYKAPIGAVLVYGSRRAAGHVEIRTKTGFVSDFQNKKPSPRPLLGIYAKA